MADSHRPIDIGTLTTFLDTLDSYSHELIQHLRSGQKVCHYTSLEGAIGIITSGDLWLTNSRYSNDDEELTYGQRLIEVVLDELEGAAAADSARLAWLRKVREALRATSADQVYICCFCETDNLLSQWRGYADNGGGVSIEFDAAQFAAIAGADSVHGLMRLWKVFYDRTQQLGIIRKCIDYPHWTPGTEDEHIRYVADALQFFTPTFKDAAFSEEQERRLIFTPYPPAQPAGAARPLPRFRSRRGLLVPYFSLLELTGMSQRFPLPIKSLLIGPGPYRKLNVESARMMLAQHGHADVPVQESATPYRG